MTSLLSLWLFHLWAGPAHAKRPTEGPPVTVPTIAEVVEREGFVAAPSLSEIYRPGAVLVPNRNGSHDVVVGDCVNAAPTVSIMSQSRIATTLAGGVSARLTSVRAAASAGIEKRLSFVNPEQRTIALGDLVPTSSCIDGVARAASLQNLEDAFVVNDVLVAMVKSTVCMRSDAKGGVFTLGEAEAAAYSECVEETPSQVPLGFKGVPLTKVLALAPGGASVNLKLAPAGTLATAPKPPEPTETSHPTSDSGAAPVASPPASGRTRTTPPPPAAQDASGDEAHRSRTEPAPAGASHRGRTITIGIAAATASVGALMGSLGLVQRSDIRDGLQSGSMGMPTAQDEMATVNRNLIIGYTGLGLGLVIGVGGRMVWATETRADGATWSLRGEW